MQKVSLKLRDLIGDADLIVSSPYVRARQTAEVLSQIFFDVEVAEAPELVPHGPAQAMVRWLKAHARECRTAILVGHEPQLSLLASYLLAGAGDSFLEMKKSGVACLDVGPIDEIGPACAELRWLLPPKIWD